MFIYSILAGMKIFLLLYTCLRMERRKVLWKILYLTIVNVFKRSDVGSGAEDMSVVDDLGFWNKMKHDDRSR